MKHTAAVISVLCLCATVGCKNNEKQELAAVPPPVDPVQVQGYQAQPVQFEPVAPAQPAYVAPPTAVPAGASYTIRKGDSLWKIAERHYGNGQRWQDIAAANPGLVPEKLPVGKTIVLP